jgi:hypothetical protein
MHLLVRLVRFSNRRLLRSQAGSDIDAANDAAKRCIRAANLTLDYRDVTGEPVGDSVRTLLMLAFLRCPELRERITP